MSEIKRRLCILCPLPETGRFAGTDGDEVFSAVTASRLRGRGGEGFPAAEKWRLLAAAEGEKEIVVLVSGDCAGALMAENPEAVYAGAALAARAFGTDSLWFVHDRPLSGIPGAYFGVRFRPVRIDHTLSSGEETRVFAAIEGDLPLARTQPPYPTARGLFGKPTLIHSAEFLAHIPYLLSGLDANTKIVNISGDGVSPGIAEIELGIPVPAILEETGAGELKAVQIGGPNGGFLPSAGFGTVYDFDALLGAGLRMGDGSLRVLGRDRCMAREVVSCLGQTYPASCGKCAFCREGAYQLYLLWRDVTEGKANENDLALIQSIAQVAAGNAACGYGRRTGEMVLSALGGFYDEIELHLRRRCPAMVCPGMFTVHILGEKCSGCGECLNRCPAGAIEGSPGFIHVVDQSKCNQCLRCLPCGEGAIARAGMQKPATPDRPIPVGTYVPRKKGLQRKNG